MIYAISDVHGCYDEFQELLDKVSPTADDVLYLMGDVCDRGPKSAEMLRWCIDQAPDNVHFLLGNHEDMAACVVCRDPEGLEMGWDDPWCYNGGGVTAEGLLDQTDAAWRAEVLAPWLQELSPFAAVEVAGEPWMLVHAGFDPRQWTDAVDYFSCDMLLEPYSHQKEVEVGYGFGTQSEQVMIWARRGFYDLEEPCPIPVVFGHTPMPYMMREAVDVAYWERSEGPAWYKSVPADGMSAWTYLNRTNIDCGCAYMGRLCCLRLDDMETFYVDSRSRG